MKGLLIKDLKIIAEQKKFFIVAILFAALFTWTGNDITFAATYIILLTSMLTLTTISYDEFNGGMAFLLTLPTSRKIYTKEKYVFAFINLCLACVFSIIVCAIFAVAKGTTIEWDSLISTCVGCCLSMGLMLSVTIPLEFKFGAEKGRVAMISAVVAITVIGIGIYKLLTEVLDINVNKIIADVLAKLPTSGKGLEVILISVMATALVLILFISYLISSKIMKKKEF